MIIMMILPITMQLHVATQHCTALPLLMVGPDQGVHVCIHLYTFEHAHFSLYSVYNTLMSGSVHHQFLQVRQIQSSLVMKSPPNLVELQTGTGALTCYGCSWQQTKHIATPISVDYTLACPQRISQNRS